MFSCIVPDCTTLHPGYFAHKPDSDVMQVFYLDRINESLVNVGHRILV